MARDAFGESFGFTSEHSRQAGRFVACDGCAGGARRGAFGALALFVLAVASLVAASVHGTERANCGYDGVEIRYRDENELRAACQALADTVSYFRSPGFRVEPRFSLSFAGRDDGASGNGPAHGHFDAQTSRIVVYPSSSSVKPWGLDWSIELAESFLRHELVHMLVWQIIGGNRERLPREWHEFIAYAVQLDLMGRELLAEVLAKSASVHAFSDLLEVNEFTLGMNPDAFAVAAYRTYREKGRERFVGQLLRAEVVPPRFSYPFPVLPERSPTR